MALLRKNTLQSNSLFANIIICVEINSEVLYKWQLKFV